MFNKYACKGAQSTTCDKQVDAWITEQQLLLEQEKRHLAQSTKEIT